MNKGSRVFLVTIPIEIHSETEGGVSSFLCGRLRRQFSLSNPISHEEYCPDSCGCCGPPHDKNEEDVKE